jgi:hypothetical protein
VGPLDLLFGIAGKFQQADVGVGCGPGGPPISAKIRKP